MFAKVNNNFLALSSVLARSRICNYDHSGDCNGHRHCDRNGDCTLRLRLRLRSQMLIAITTAIAITIEKAIAKVHEITGDSLSSNRLQLIAETRTYAAFRETEFSLLEEALGKTMTSLSRSSSSSNDLKTIKHAFENGIQEVRVKFSEEFSSLKITIEGDRQFVDRIKGLIGKSKESGA